VVTTVPPDNKVVISEVLVLTLFCKDSSVSILLTMLYVPTEGIIFPEESNSRIVPVPVPILAVNPEILKEVIVGATTS